MPANQLTETELETLAILITSAGRRMSQARDDRGEYVWPHDPTSPVSFSASYTEMLEGFYALQPDCWAKLVHVNG
jgi:hypothetical protein